MQAAFRQSIRPFKTCVQRKKQACQYVFVGLYFCRSLKGSFSLLSVFRLICINSESGATSEQSKFEPMQFTDKTIILSSFHEFDLFSVFLELNLRDKNEQNWHCTLAKDLKNENAAVLCRAEKQIDAHIFSLLEKVHDRNPNFNFHIEIWKDKEIKKRLKEVFQTTVLIQMNSNYIIEKAGKPIFDYYDDKFTRVIDHVLNNENLLYSLYGHAFFNMKEKKGQYAFDRQIISGIRRALMALGIAFTDKQAREDEFYEQIFLTAFVLSFCMIEIQTKRLHDASYQKKALDLTLKNLDRFQGELKLDAMIWQAIKLVIESKFASNYDYIDQDSEVATLAQIVAVGDLFEQLIALEADTQVDASRALDIIYVLAKKGKFKQKPVDDLAHWLEMQEVFRFYKTLERLENSCHFGPNKENLAVPYPMRGVGSPTLFVCKGNNTACEHLSSAFKKINIQEATYNLRFGAYTKCSWLTNELKVYYNKYYSKIKDESGAHENPAKG